MRFPLNIYFLSGLGGGLIAALALPLWRDHCRRIGLVDDPGHRKIHAQPMPLAGGLAIWTAIAISLLGMIALLKLGWMDAETIQKSLFGLFRRRGQLMAIFGGATGMMILGALDDKHELRPAIKFAGQLIIASLVAAAGIRITLFVPSVVFSYAITVLWILTVTNAFNFMDNMNGLCAGLGAIAAFWFGLASALHGHYLVAAISFLTCGALLGFLPFNFPRATAFLGDSGSHLIGYLLAVLAILAHFYTKKSPHHWAVLSPLLILSIPLADLAWVVALRWRLGRPFYVGDNNHLSHRLVRCGLSQTQAVLLIWVFAAGVGALAFLWI